MKAATRFRAMIVFICWPEILLFAGSNSATTHADPLGVGPGVVFKLTPRSAYQEGCLPPCLCPLWTTSPILGTMTLGYVDGGSGIHTYKVRDVNWAALGLDPTIRTVGEGTYRVGSPGPATVMQHRMELDLSLNGLPVQHFDSGWVPVSNNGILNLDVALNHFMCYDQVFHVEAMRVSNAELRPYRLAPDGTFQRGCFDPCDCPLGPKWPLGGDFSLVHLLDTALFSVYGVVDVGWHVATPDVVQVMSIRGSGLYWVGGEFAAQQRMMLDLMVGGEDRARFDSGWVVGGGLVPHLDVVISMNQMVCLDTVMHVVAHPVNASVCGGFSGIACGPGEFCKLPEGHCCCDFQGVCLSLPGACPAVFNPVCGCDGITYSNECEADRAGVSVDHRGPCRAACAGPNQPGCPPDAFCKFPPGSCDVTNSAGICAPIPMVCPEIWNPVCGCDGVTYGSECHADAAGVSLAHPGPCAVDTCPATRSLADPTLDDCAATKLVRVVLNLPSGVLAIAAEDGPPAGWTVSGISHHGSYDALNHKVKWGPLFPPFPNELSYSVMPVPNMAGPRCFSGVVSLEGHNVPICGDDCLHACCPLLAADAPGPPCSSCPVSSCGECASAGCDDGRVSLCEVIGFACAWMFGCHDDLSGMTRAAFLWRAGECYCWDSAVQNWTPSDCSSANSSCCGGSRSISDSAPAGGGSSAFLRVVAADRLGRRGVYGVRVDVNPEPSNLATAVEVDLPGRWFVSSISDGGRFDPVHGKVKWGPFMDSRGRVLTFRLTDGLDRETKADRLRNAVQVGTQPGLKQDPARRGLLDELLPLTGRVSFDGVVVPMTGG